MSKRILIVESDSNLSRNMRGALEKKGFGVDETTDGKGCVELIRRERPDLVLLAVDLAANQNGYLICGKLKKDDELKAIPVVIVGSPDGFTQHKKLKTRADEYVAKPVDLPAMVSTVGGIVGFPEPAGGDVVEDESLSLSELVEDEPSTGELAAEEIAVDTADDGTVEGDPALDMLDAAFDDISAQPNGAASEESVEAPPEEAQAEEELSGFETLGDDGDVSADAESALDGLGGGADGPTHTSHRSPFPAPTSPPPPLSGRAALTLSARPPTGLSPADATELRELRSRVKELEAALEDANQRAGDAERSKEQLETELEAKSAEVETAKSAAAGSGKTDKEFFALREAGNKKDKEILRLKSELNAKDQEIVELKDREMQLEQKASDSSGEMARHQAQLKTLTTRADQLAAERKRVDAQLMQAKEEARGATARLSTVQAELEELTGRAGALENEANELRARAEESEAQLGQLRAELEEARAASEGSRGELEDARNQLEQANSELESAKSQLTSQATAFAEEASALRRRVSELEDTSAKHEERVTKLYGRIKGDEKVREKTKKALSIALQLLEEQQALPEEDDEPAVA